MPLSLPWARARRNLLEGLIFCFGWCCCFGQALPDDLPHIGFAALERRGTDCGGWILVTFVAAHTGT